MERNKTPQLHGGSLLHPTHGAETDVDDIENHTIPTNATSDATSNQEPETSTRSACDHVLDIYELCEHILSVLPFPDLLLSQRVCTRFRDVIARSRKLQELLYLAPAKDIVPQSEHPLKYAILDGAAHMQGEFDRRTRGLYNLLIYCFGHDWQEHMYGSSRAADLKGKDICGSRLNMFATQPPLKSMNMALWRRVGRHNIRIASVVNEDGITFGDMLRKAQSAAAEPLYGRLMGGGSWRGALFRIPSVRRRAE